MEASEDLPDTGNRGDVDAHLKIICALYGGDRVGNNLILAAHYSMLAGNQGNAVGQFNYGVCLKYGYGVHDDKLSADQGFVDGIFDGLH
jgi:TPR repeat protein